MDAAAAAALVREFLSFDADFGVCVAVTANAAE
jgi:hypothetical protein